MLEKTGFKPGVICCYYDVFYCCWSDVFMCVAEVSEGNYLVLYYLINCYLHDCGMVCWSHSMCVRSHSRTASLYCEHYVYTRICTYLTAYRLYINYHCYQITL